MKNLIQAAVVTLFAASAAQAQQAVQWKVSDGGNGHWYRIVTRTTACWDSVRLEAEGIGGYLATLVSPQEDAWVRSQLPDVPWYFIGGRQQPDACEPGCGWYWVTGEPFVPMWDSSQPDGDLPWTVPQDILTTYRRGWHDGPDCGDLTDCGGGCPFGGFIVEWSADCNSDGVVDYGQCRDGSLPDYNGNNIPDCCEADASCPAGQYPVQWRTSDGGNGHWYLFAIPTSSSIDWPTAQSWAESKGGYLASLTTVAESTWCRGVVTDVSGWWLPHTNPSQYIGPWIGGYQIRSATDYSEPSGGWRWISGEAWIWPNWMPGQPDDGCGGEDFLHLITIGGGFPTMTWNDFNGLCGWMPKSLLVEWSGDCNNDGIVDYGQILQGQLADLDSNGVPDDCQQPTCVDADLFRDFNVNGADLGILLSQWGPNSPLTVSDINSDGVVNGADLGILLSFWGSCTG